MNACEKKAETHRCNSMWVKYNIRPNACKSDRSAGTLGGQPLLVYIWCDNRNIIKSHSNHALSSYSYTL